MPAPLDFLPMSFMQLLTGYLSPGGGRGKLSTLIYHRVLKQPDALLPGEVDAVSFEWQMNVLAQHFNVLPLSEAVERLKKKSLPKRAVCVTFDDGYADNAEVALPILKKHGVPATFFVATGFLNGGMMWNDRVTEAVRHAQGNIMDLSSLGLGKHAISDKQSRFFSIKKLLGELKYFAPDERLEKVGEIIKSLGTPLSQDFMMSHAQVKTLSQQGMSIGAHTVNHPILQKINSDKAYQEIADCRDLLKDLVGHPIDLFAYPNGKPNQDYGEIHIQHLKDLGFTSAVTTAWGVSTALTDVYQLPRFTPWDKSPKRFMARLLQNCMRTKVETVS